MGKYVLPETAAFLLKECIMDESGKLTIYESSLDGSYTININRKDITAPMDDPARKRQLQDAIRELERLKLIEPKSSSKDRYEVTQRAYEFVRNL